MKWLRTLVLFDKGDVISSEDWETVHSSYVRAIESIDHPAGTGSLTLREKVRLPGNKWKRNGVGYLRTRFLEFMRDQEKWHIESDVDLARDRKQPPILLYPTREPYREPITSDFGGFDFMTTAKNGNSYCYRVGDRQYFFFTSKHEQASNRPNERRCRNRHFNST